MPKSPVRPSPPDPSKIASGKPGAVQHPSRLNRDFGRKRWGDEGYAMEELVAELGSAFLCADLDLTPEPREDHAAYIASWLKVLKNDKRAEERQALCIHRRRPRPACRRFPAWLAAQRAPFRRTEGRLNLEPRRDIGRMVLAWLQRQPKVGAWEGGAKLGNKLLACVPFVAPTLPAEIAVEARWMASSVCKERGGGHSAASCNKASKVGSR